jgi:hypothetical protein
LKAYIETNLANGFIQWSSSLAAAPILFPKKKDRSLLLCVQYPAHNLGGVKHAYPVPVISEMFDVVCGARIVASLGLWNVYHLICMKEWDEYKMAF